MQSDDYFSNGEIYFELKNFARAIVMYNQALKAEDCTHPANIYLKRGIAHYKINNHDEALADFELLSSLNETYFKISFIFLGIIFEYKADHCTNLKEKMLFYQKAAAAYREVAANFVEANEKFNLLYNKLSRLKLVANQICFPQGIKLIANSSWINAKNNIEIHNRSIIEKVKQYKDLNYLYNGDIYYYLGLYGHAIHNYTISIETIASAEKYHRRGKAYFQIKDYKKALQDFSKAIELNPHLTHAYLFRARTINNQIKPILPYAFFFQIQDGWWQIINDLAKAVSLEPYLIEAKGALNNYFDTTSEDNMDHARLSPEAQKLLIEYKPDDKKIRSNLAYIQQSKQTVTVNTTYMSLGFLPRLPSQEKIPDITSQEKLSLS